MMQDFPLYLLEQSRLAEAESLSKLYGFRLLHHPDWLEAKNSRYLLVLSGRGLYLMPQSDLSRLDSPATYEQFLSAGKGAIAVEFSSGKNAHRRQYGGGKGQLIARAAGIRSGVFPDILDVSAGFGADGFVFASLGCRVTLLERNPVVFCLLQDGLKRAAASDDPDLRELVSRIDLHFGDAAVSLSSSGYGALVAYFDPMFPEKKKQAASNKTMTAFHHIVGSDSDAGEVLHLLLQQDFSRVVVKRPRLAASLCDKPNLVFTGKSGRFDVYARKKLTD